MTHVYTRERHENKNTRFWATYVHTRQVVYDFYAGVCIRGKRNKKNVKMRQHNEGNDLSLP